METDDTTDTSYHHPKDSKPIHRQFIDSNYYSAGVLPFVIADGQVFVLLGVDASFGQFSDFGGRVAVEDRHNPQCTAAREFCEETLGVVSDYQTILFQIQQLSDDMCIISKTLCQYEYRMYLLRIAYNKDITVLYEKSARFLKHFRLMRRKFCEKSSLRWASLDSVIAQSIRSTSLSSTPASVNIDESITVSPSPTLTLRDIFSQTIKNHYPQMISAIQSSTDVDVEFPMVRQIESQITK